MMAVVENGPGRRAPGANHDYLSHRHRRWLPKMPDCSRLPCKVGDRQLQQRQRQGIRHEREQEAFLKNSWGVFGA